jgi:phage terminase large subunit-like protein
MDAASFGREMYNYCRDVLRGSIQDEMTFALVYEVPEGADPYSEQAQRAANPMYGLSVRPEILRAAAEKAKRFASHRPAYLVKHCNVWVTAALAYFDVERFMALGDPTLKLDDFAGQPCILGLDLAGTSAFTAKTRLFFRDLPHADPLLAAQGETQRHYYAFVSYWLNRRAIEASSTDAYTNWVDGGWVEVAGQDVTDFTPAKNEIVEDLQRFSIPEIRCDPHLINQLVTLVEDDAPHAPFIELPQRTQYLSPAMKEMNNAILEGRFHHDGNPVFAWNVGNVEAKEDANENVFPLKSGGKASTNYIDGVSATINAIGGAMDAKPPAYSEGGLFFVDFDED